MYFSDSNDKKSSNISYIRANKYPELAYVNGWLSAGIIYFS